MGLLLLLNAWLPAQNEKQLIADSLKTVLEGELDDKQRVDAMVLLSETIYNTAPDEADSISRIAASEGMKIRYWQGAARATYIQFKLFKSRGKYEEALTEIRKMKAYRRSQNDSIAYANDLVNESSLHTALNDYKLGMECLLEALSILHGTENYNALALIYSNMGTISFHTGNLDEALQYYNKSLEVNLRINFEKGISVNYNNIGNVYRMQNNTNEAIANYKKAIGIKEKIGDKNGLFKCTSNIGVILNEMNDPEQALVFNLKALDMAIDLDSPKDISMSYINLGYTFLGKKAHDLAIEYAIKGLRYAEEADDINLSMEAELLLSTLYAEKKQFDKAYASHLSYKLLSDSIIKTNNLSEVNALKLKFATVQKDNEINALRISTAEQDLKLRQARIYIMLSVSVILVIASLVIFFRQKARNSRKVQAKLEEINKIKSAFFANLSHEFRTPLTLMLGPAKRLIETVGPNEKPLAELIHRNANRLLALDEQLLQFTKIDSGTQKLHLVKGDIIPLIAAVASSFTYLAEKKRIDLQLKYPSLAAELHFDADIVEKVVGNLLSNAIKYTPSGGKVKLEVGLEEAVELSGQEAASSYRSLIIKVTDNGIGIPSAKQQVIFERFYQLGNTADSTFDGYGIGLALVKELLQLHKGWIRLNSEPGVGSEFTVALPAESHLYPAEALDESKRFVIDDFKPEKSVMEELSSSHTTGENLNSQKEVVTKEYKLLFVDDNRDMRTYINTIFGSDYQLLLAADGAEGLALALKHQPDLVLTDIMMEGMDGLEFCRQLKSNSKTQHIPVIMLTALAETDEKVEGLEQGADDYIVKPFSQKELMARINNLISQRTVLKNLFTRELKIEPGEVSITSAEASFLTKLIQLIEDQMDNPDLEIGYLASRLGMSRSQLYRKVNATTKQPAVNFVRIIRMKRAAQLIEKKAGNISEIMYAVGFNNLSYFSKCFKEVYQITPSEFSAQCQRDVSA